MKQRIARGLDRVDRTAGKVVARFWGSVLVVGIVAILVPMLVLAVASGAWVATLISLAAMFAMAALARYLFSRDRRLSDFE